MKPPTRTRVLHEANRSIVQRNDHENRPSRSAVQAGRRAEKEKQNHQTISIQFIHPPSELNRLEHQISWLVGCSRQHDYAQLVVCLFNSFGFMRCSVLAYPTQEANHSHNCASSVYRTAHDKKKLQTLM
jgi:hypothetical protein